MLISWNGQRWTASKLPAWVVRIAGDGTAHDVAAAFSARNVWNFSLGAEQNPAMAARYNGRRWVRVYLPGEPVAVSALTASDIWAVGPSRKTLSKPAAQRVDVAMHWNGHTWRTIRLPKVTQPAVLAGDLSGLVAMGPRDVWAGMPTGGTVSARRGILLHWNGRRWNRVSAPRGVFNFDTGAPVAQDGHGGLWLQDSGTVAPFPLYLYHYSHGHFTRYTMPHGSDVNLLSFAWIPGTRSVWAAGHIVTGGTTKGLIAKHGA